MSIKSIFFKSFILAIFICCQGETYAQNYLAKTLCGGIGYHITTGFDSSYYCAGTTGRALLLVKTNLTGDTVWTKTFGNTTCSSPVEINARSIIKSDSFTFVICGNRKICGVSGNSYVIKVDSSGNELWENEYTSSNSILYSIVECGNYYYACGTISLGNYSDGLLIKLDKSGNLIWEKDFDFGGTEAFNDLLLKNDTEIVIAGESNSFSANQYNDAEIFTFDIAGNYKSNYQFGGTQYDGFNSIQLVSDSYYFSGSSATNANGDKNGYVVKTDSNFNQLWTLNYGDQFENVCFGSLIVGDKIFLSGWTFGNSILSNAWLLVADTNGDFISEMSIGDSVFQYSYSLSGFGQKLALIGNSTDGTNQVYLIFIDSILNVISQPIYSIPDLVEIENPIRNGVLKVKNSGSTDRYTLEIFNGQGKLIQRNSIFLAQDAFTEIELRNTSSAMYFVNFRTAFDSCTLKFIIP